MSMPTRRVYLRLDEDAAALLDQLAPSENKRGEFVSALLRQAGDGQSAAGDGELEWVRRELFQTAAGLNMVANQLMELVGQPARFVATRTSRSEPGVPQHDNENAGGAGPELEGLETKRKP